jgi:PAS domain S-box-containing protein
MAFMVTAMLGGTPPNPRRSQPAPREWAGAALAGDDGRFRQVLDALPAAIYITDAEGRLTYYNEAAVTLWGYRPELGASQWCGSWRLYQPDGTDLPHDQCPMAIALREGRPVRGVEAVAERPDGIRVPFIPFPTPLHDAAGQLIGAVNMLVDISDRKKAEMDGQRLASIVESSDDAIISKDIDGIITSWNRGAERLFGYAAEEVIGHPINILIPLDRRDEETDILLRIRRGEKIDHYETIRRRKDGSLVEISLCVSPMKNAEGKIIGASKIARDITERRRGEELQHTLLREMDHRVKNLFTLSSSVVALSARSATTAPELASAVMERLGALARAHALTLPKSPRNGENATTLHALVRTISAPFDEKSDGSHGRVAISGPDIPVAGSAVTSLALLLHEFATNAAKYGALSVPKGYVHIEGLEQGDQFLLTWQEHGGPRVEPTDAEGFGTMLARATVKRQLGGEISRDWKPEGLTIRLCVARDRVAGA